MIGFPNAKINLGLNILGKRSDGFHDIETVLYPIGLSDVLEIIPARNGKTEFVSSGLPIPGTSASNLCLRALVLMKSAFPVASAGRRYPEILPVRIHLHKVIPMGAGLGGGSSDGAFTLKLLNELFELDLSVKQLFDYTRQLGSDTSFFIENKPAFASQKGDHLSPVSISLKGYKLILIIPPVHVSTPEAYSLIKPGQPEESVNAIIHLPVHEWKGLLVNDFEKPVMDKYPVIREVKEKLYDSGAVYASMSGSGSAVYGIFKENISVENLFPGCMEYISSL